jgi:TMEM175 potassium channel family protein
VPEDQPPADSRSVDRLIFFSDAVIAIAITLLAIDLPVPQGNSVGQFWSSVRDNDGHYAAFLISFAVIAASWASHHELFRYTTRADTRLRSLNMAWLMMIVLNPFATKLLTSRAEESLDVHALRFGFYALLQLLAAVFLFAMLRHMTAYLETTGAARPAVSSMAWQSIDLMLGFGVSIPLLFVTSYAWVLWFAVPAVVIRLRHRARAAERP